MEFILWLIAVVLVISGIVYLVRGAVAWGFRPVRVPEDAFPICRVARPSSP